MTFSTSPSPGVTLQGGGSSGGGGGGTPGGSSGQVQYNNGGAFGGMAGTSWDNTTRALTITGYSLTGSANASFMDLAGTWNTTGTPTAIKLNITDTASNAASLLMDLQRGGVSQFNVNRTGMTSIVTGIANSGVATLRLYGVSGTNNSRGGLSFYSTFPTGADTGPRRLSDIYSGFADTTWNNAYINLAVATGANDAADITTTSMQITRLGASLFSQLSLFPTANNPSTADLFLTRRGAANLRLGAADAAAPVAQTLSVQSVVAGTTNTIGQEFRIDGSQGTGTGAGGSLVFRVAPAGSSGSAQNALATALTIASDLSSNFSGNIFSTQASFSLGNNSTRCVTFGGGVATFTLNGNSTLVVNDSNGVEVRSALRLGWSDVQMWRDAANKLALKNGANAQEFRVYETTAGTIYKAILGDRGLMKISGAAFADGAGAQAGTLTNAPAIGNPTKWISIDDNGTTRYIPAW